MVSPITIVDETLNNIDEIVITLNFDLNIDGVYYDIEVRETDASTISTTDKTAISIIEEDATSTIEKAATSATEQAATTEKAATSSVEKAATSTIEKAATSTTEKAATSTTEKVATKTITTKPVQEQIATKPTMRIYTKASPNLSLSIRYGYVVLANSNPLDPYQHWFIYSSNIKDKQGYPSFFLVNKATGQAIKHSIGYSHPVRLVTYNPNKIDESVLWTSKDVGDSFMTIRASNNISLLFDALNDNGFRDGTKIILWGHFTGNNQCWRIDPYISKPIARMFYPKANHPSVRIYTKAWTNYFLSIRKGNVIIAINDPSDPLQHWIKDEKFGANVKDEQGNSSFALVNKATGEAIKHSWHDYPVQLIPYDPNKINKSVLWTESKDLGDSYRTIRVANNIRLLFDALNHTGVRDGTKVILWEHLTGDNQRWKMVPS